MNKHVFTTAFALALCLTLTGCGDRMLERSYSSVTPHSAAYWENEDADTLRAENYQDLVNALLLLLGEHSEDGIVRIYGDALNKERMAERACVEVQQETALGAYLLDYMTYGGESESAYYELRVRFGYRRTAEEQAAIVNATSTEALPDLLRAAVEEGRDAVAIRVGYFGTDRAGVLALVRTVHEEVFPPEEAPSGEVSPEGDLPPEGEAPGEEETQQPEQEAQERPPEETDAPPEGETSEEAGEPESGEDTPPEEPAYDLSPWQVLFYPDDAQPGIVEVILTEKPDA